MITLQRTDSSNENFRYLTGQLDQYLAKMNGSQHSFYDQFNKIHNISHCIVAIQDDQGVACGAIKEFSHGAAEVKRMFVLPDKRNQGIAFSVLRELELWAKELGYSTCILETGRAHHDAIALYQKAGYKVIPNYGQYQGVDNSICMEKSLDVK
jgi:GNAT superfamily N-acetyltransferase